MYRQSKRRNTSAVLSRFVGPFRYCAASLLAVVFSYSTQAQAAGPLGAERGPIRTSNYAVDLFEGPLLTSSRVTGLGGAYSALAFATDGNVVNPAAPVLRVPWSYPTFDYDLDVGLTLPYSLKRTDFDNDGRVGFTYENFYFLYAAANLQVDNFGAGLFLDTHSYTIPSRKSVPNQPSKLEVQFTRAHLGAAYQIRQGEFAFGAAIRSATLSITDKNKSDNSLFTTTGAGLEFGVLWAPVYLPIRAALAARTPVKSEIDSQNTTVETLDSGDTTVGGIIVPNRVVQPYEIEIGFAFQLGPRPLNTAWVAPDGEIRALRAELALENKKLIEHCAEQSANNQPDPKPPNDTFQQTTPEPDSEKTPQDCSKENLEQHEKLTQQKLKQAPKIIRQRRKDAYLKMSRTKLLVSSSLLISGPVSNAVSIESFFEQQVHRSGEKTVFTPRLGAEVEPIPNWLQARAGAYYEPSRFRDGTPRLHGTIGAEVKLLPWSVFGLFDDDTWWKAGLVLDVAARYQSIGIAASVWRLATHGLPIAHRRLSRETRKICSC